MTKKKAIWVVVIMAILLAVSVFTAAVGWGPTGTGAARNIIRGLDLQGGVSITYQTVGDETPSEEDMIDTIAKLQKRVDGYSTEASVYQEGENRINIEIPGATDATTVLEELGKPGSLQFVEPDGTVIMDGSEVVHAEPASTKDSTTGSSEFVVSLEFTEAGKEAFAEASSRLVGQQISIVYDGETLSAPTVQQAITDGKCQISGNFTMESASTLASNIRIGSLTLELEEIRSNVVGAQLGQKALSTSLIAGIVGLILVIILMIVVYKIPGVIAGISLAMYAALELVLLNAYDLTLTLAGIAGVILSIGMAVDANVIIYARIREEIAAGNSVKAAIDTGFKKALSAILDGNITTLIAALVLYLRATGTVKGFATTLGMGIILSMFTALVISRLLVNAAYALGMKDAKYFGKKLNIKPIDFISRRKTWFVISILVILIGPASMLIQKGAGNDALNLSMEFRGGTSTDVTFTEDYTIEEIDEKIKPVFQEITGSADIQAQKVAGGNEVIIKTGVLTPEQREAVETKLRDEIGVQENTDINFETISGTISNEMRQDAFVAVVIAIILMLIYIAIRFSDFRFASAAVLALCHDVLVVFACYALVRISIGNTFIACMLTIVGYSINATIVIFDRIRENLKTKTSKQSLADLVNESINSTLTRSIYTSLTTFITIAMLYILGVPSIKEFAMPLMVGIVAGGYSSVFITGSLWYVMRTRADKKAELAAKEAKKSKSGKK